MSCTIRRGLALTLAVLPILAGCLPRPSVPLAPDAATSSCEAAAALALRARTTGFQSVTLDAPPTARLERRATRVGSQPIELVLAGQGTVHAAGGRRDLRYLCLVAPSGESVFIDVETADAAEILGECGASPAGRNACLADLLRQTEKGLAEVEARSVARAQARGSAARRSELDEPVATSIGAWRVYRDAECARRGAQATGPEAETVQLCRIELTRARIHELSG